MLTKDGNKFITYQETVVTNYGVPVVDANDKRFFTASGAGIMVDGYTIDLSIEEQYSLKGLKELGKVPAHYTVRTKKDHRFVCGLDLMSNGTVWVGVQTEVNVHGSTFNTIQDVLAVVARHLNDEPFYVSLEEAFPL